MTAKTEKKLKALLIGLGLFMLAVPVALAIRADRERNGAVAAAPAADAAACRTNLQCWGKKHEMDMIGPCTRAVQNLAKFDHEWTDSWSHPKFSKWGWDSQKAGTLVYLGDALKLQNGFGAWENHRYACYWAPTAKTVTHARAEPGRFDR